jgi:hypothetical protein
VLRNHVESPSILRVEPQFEHQVLRHRSLDSSRATGQAARVTSRYERRSWGPGGTWRARVTSGPRSYGSHSSSNSRSSPAALRAVATEVVHGSPKTRTVGTAPRAIEVPPIRNDTASVDGRDEFTVLVGSYVSRLHASTHSPSVNSWSRLRSGVPPCA